MVSAGSRRVARGPACSGFAMELPGDPALLARPYKREHSVAASDTPQPDSPGRATAPGRRSTSPGLTPVAAGQLKRTIWSGVLAGFGLAAFVDESVFHQILHWHHFYDKSSMAIGLLSDGLFHAFGFTSMVVGLFLLADSLRRGGFIPKRWWGALLLGWGGFQLYDGTIQHKILGLHQIRYHVTIWPYDLTWNTIAFIMIVTGALLMRGHAGIARSGIFRTDADPAA